MAERGGERLYLLAAAACACPPRTIPRRDALLELVTCRSHAAPRLHYVELPVGARVFPAPHRRGGGGVGGWWFRMLCARDPWRLERSTSSRVRRPVIIDLPRPSPRGNNPSPAMSSAMSRSAHFFAASPPRSLDPLRREIWAIYQAGDSLRKLPSRRSARLAGGGPRRRVREIGDAPSRNRAILQASTPGVALGLRLAHWGDAEEVACLICRQTLPGDSLTSMATARHACNRARHRFPDYYERRDYSSSAATSLSELQVAHGIESPRYYRDNSRMTACATIDSATPLEQSLRNFATGNPCWNPARATSRRAWGDRQDVLASTAAAHPRLRPAQRSTRARTASDRFLGEPRLVFSKPRRRLDGVVADARGRSLTSDLFRPGRALNTATRLAMKIPRRCRVSRARSSDPLPRLQHRSF